MDSESEFPSFTKALDAESQQNGNDSQQNVFSQTCTSSGIQFPKTPVKPKGSKRSLKSMLESIRGLDEKKAICEDVARSDSPKLWRQNSLDVFQNDFASVLGEIQQNVDGNRNSLELELFDFFHDENSDVEMSAAFFQPTSTIRIDRKEQILEVAFSRLIFAKNNAESVKLFNTINSRIASVTWTPKLEQILAILCAYGLKFNSICEYFPPYVFSELKNKVSTYLNQLLTNFQVPRRNLSMNLPILFTLLERFVECRRNSFFGEIVKENALWIVALLALCIDKTIKSNLNLELSLRKLLLATVSILPNNICREIFVDLIPVFVNLSDGDPLILAEICEILKKSELQRSIVLRVGFEFGREMFSFLNTINGAALKSYIPLNSTGIGEFSKILKCLDQPILVDLLTKEKRLCFSWVSVLQTCLSIDFLKSQQNRSQVNEFVNLLNFWHKNLAAFGNSPECSRIKVIVFLLLERFQEFCPDCNNAIDEPIIDLQARKSLSITKSAQQASQESSPSLTSAILDLCDEMDVE